VDLHIHSPLRLHDVVLHKLGKGTTLPFFILSGLPSECSQRGLTMKILYEFLASPVVVTRPAIWFSYISQS
jgi:hypothetical protein